LLAQRSVAVLIASGALLAAGCHNADRSNPLDTSLTPTVQLAQVSLDSLQASATLTWSSYTGNQPFRAYEIRRRFSGTTTSEVIHATTDIADTTYRDSTLDVDRVAGFCQGPGAAVPARDV
jgi:hypothetical protein